MIGVPPHELIRRRYVEKADTVRYGPHPRVNFADIWHRRDLPRDGKAPVLLQVPGGAWTIGMRRPQAYPLLSHMAERGWVCVSIDYRVSKAGKVTLEVYDARGTKVRSLVNDVKKAGSYTASFNADGMASGVYFYRLKAVGVDEMKKMVLLK